MSPARIDFKRETMRRMRRISLQLGEDIRRLRLDAHVSIAAVGRATGIHPAHIGRIESGEARPSNEALIAIGVALGADLSIRYFPGTGPRIHDRFQAPMVETLLRVLDPRWQVELEVPVTQPARGVIDAVLHDRASGTVVATEVQSDLQRIEQQIRWANEKADGLAARGTEIAGPLRIERPVSQLLVLRSTIRTRDLARQYAATLRTAFPARSSAAYGSLTGSTPWPGAAIVWMHVHGSRVSLMRHPPPGVEVGR